MAKFDTGRAAAPLGAMRLPLATLGCCAILLALFLFGPSNRWAANGRALDAPTSLTTTPPYVSAPATALEARHERSSIVASGATLSRQDKPIYQSGANGNVALELVVMRSQGTLNRVPLPRLFVTISEYGALDSVKVGRVTDLSGTVHFDDLVPGRYVLKSGGLFRRFIDVVVSPVTYAECILASLVAVEGVVVNEAGEPIPLAAILVSCESNRDELDLTVTTDLRGGFAVLLSVSDARYLRAIAEGYELSHEKLINATHHIAEGGVTLEFVLCAGGHTISGVVLDAAGSAIKSADVVLFSSRSGGGSWQASNRVRSCPQLRTATDHFGRFEFGGLPRLDYTLVASVPGFARCVHTCERGRNENVEIRLEHGATIEGIVLSAERQPLLGVNIGFGQRHDPNSMWTITDAAGRFALVGLRGDDYKLMCWYPGWRSLEREIRVAAAEQIMGVEFVLAPDAPSMSGIISPPRAPNGTNWTVTLRDSGRSVSRPVDDGRFVTPPWSTAEIEFVVSYDSQAFIPVLERRLKFDPGGVAELTVPEEALATTKVVGRVIDRGAIGRRAQSTQLRAPNNVILGGGQIDQATGEFLVIAPCADFWAIEVLDEVKKCIYTAPLGHLQAGLHELAIIEVGELGHIRLVHGNPIEETRVVTVVASSGKQYGKYRLGGGLINVPPGKYTLLVDSGDGIVTARPAVVRVGETSDIVIDDVAVDFGVIEIVVSANGDKGSWIEVYSDTEDVPLRLDVPLGSHIYRLRVVSGRWSVRFCGSPGLGMMSTRSCTVAPGTVTRIEFGA